MYEKTPEQIKSEKNLKKDGFKFSNWIPAIPDANNDPAEGRNKINVWSEKIQEEDLIEVIK